MSTTAMRGGLKVRGSRDWPGSAAAAARDPRSAPAPEAAARAPHRRTAVTKMLRMECSFRMHTGQEVVKDAAAPSGGLGGECRRPLGGVGGELPGGTSKYLLPPRKALEFHELAEEGQLHRPGGA